VAGIRAGERGDAPSLADYLRVLSRRRWIVLEALLLVPLAAVLFSLSQERLYESSAEVLLSHENVAASLTGATDPRLFEQADRVAQTQARLARVPAVVEATLEAAGRDDLTVKDFLDRSEVTASTNADILVFSVTDPSRAQARRLATEYAREFTHYRLELDTASIASARREVQQRIAELEESGERRTALHTSLVEKEQQLATLEALQTANASVVREASETEQVQPRVVRNGMLGLVLGLVIGVALAFLFDAIDTRVRSAEEIAERLGLPLLGRLPEPARKLRNRDQLAMLTNPSGAEAEAFRMLRTNLAFSLIDRDVRTIMVTSAVEQEGKSTSVANLAVALARGGQRVALVDLDLRRPYLGRFFGLDGARGVTQVALGHVDLHEALVPFVADGSGGWDVGSSQAAEATNGGRRVDGMVLVLPAGALPPDPGEFMATQALADVLARLREETDFVLIDSPPLLHVGDALALSARVDAVVVVARANLVRRGVLEELRRVLDGIPAQKLGFVLTGAEEEAGYQYGYSSPYQHERERDTVG
jgi:succinoglycan biosynthesis transport protein ExoP